MQSGEVLSRMFDGSAVIRGTSEDLESGLRYERGFGKYRIQPESHLLPILASSATSKSCRVSRANTWKR